MFNFLHNYIPDPVMISFFGLDIHWYGFFIGIGAISAFFVCLKLAVKYGVEKEKFVDLVFWLMIFGILGARIYYIFLEFDYFLANPLDVFAVWKGGLAIHGAIIAGLATIFVFGRKKGLDFWKISAIVAPGLALGQAFGRWGNYFNQELFGPPTSSFIGIPIELINRPMNFLGEKYFHPAFLYESLANFSAFLILSAMHFYFIKKNKQSSRDFRLIVFTYLFLYGLIRFLTEFIRIDETAMIWGFRFPQVLSLILIITSLSAGVVAIIKPRRS